MLSPTKVKAGFNKKLLLIGLKNVYLTPPIFKCRSFLLDLIRFFPETPLISRDRRKAVAIYFFVWLSLSALLPSLRLVLIHKA